MPLVLVEVAGAAEGSRMRHGHRGKAAHPVGVVRREVPTDCGAPVVADNVGPLKAQGVHKRDRIDGEFHHPIGVHIGWSGPRRVASLVRGVGAKARHVQRRHYGVPHPTVLRKSVQQ